jgi:membrane-associated phospholipid phosphatase
MLKYSIRRVKPGRLTGRGLWAKQRPMLLWAGILLVAAGVAAIAADRRLSHALYERVSAPLHRFLESTTHMAKASHWLVAAAIIYAVSQLWSTAAGVAPYALAFIVSLGAGSLVLHIVKLVLGRRRPRDDIEMSLYGFKLFALDTDYNSFPSGHALTIMCVAAVASCAWPMLAPLWFALAAWLGLTRALLTAHYLSDVLVGAGIGLISAHETVIHVFPGLAPAWF